MKKLYFVLLLLIFVVGCGNTNDDPSDRNNNGGAELEDSNGDNGVTDDDESTDSNDDVIDDDSTDSNDDTTDNDSSNDMDDNDETDDETTPDPGESDDETVNDPSEAFWDMLALFVSFYNDGVAPLEVSAVGVEHDTLEVGSGGNRYMDDGEVINYSNINTVTSPYYAHMTERFNKTTATNLNGNLQYVLPLIGLLDEMEEPVSNDMGEVMLTYNEDYGHYIVGHFYVQDYRFDLTVLIEDLQLLNQYEMIVYLESDAYEYYYRMTRSLTEIISMLHMERYLDDEHGFMELSYIEDLTVDAPQLFTYRYDGGVHRRWLYDIADSHTTIYYHNDTTGTEIIQYLNSENELIFEYEDYAANQSLVGTHKARWFLSNSIGWNTITLEEKGFMGGSSVYHIDDTKVPRDSNDFRIEAKAYKTISMVDNSYQENTTATWVYRIDGAYDDDRLFNLDPTVGITNASHVKNITDTHYNSRATHFVFDHNIMDITNQDIIDYIRFIEE